MLSFRRSDTLALVVVCSLAGGCASANPMHFEDQVNAFHEDLRWGRMPAAERIVAAQTRESFARRHAGWGRAIQIMDVEVEGTHTTGLSNTATSTARYIWMRQNDLTTRETEVETRWHGNVEGSWVCEDELVVSGDPTLLSTLRPPGVGTPTPR